LGVPAKDLVGGYFWLGDGSVAVGRGVLVDEGGLGAGVAHAGHQLLGGGSCGGGLCVPSVPEVVESQIRHTGGLASRPLGDDGRSGGGDPGRPGRPGSSAPGSLHGVEPERPTVALREEEVVGVGPDVVGQGGFRGRRRCGAEWRQCVGRPRSWAAR
jgi:hypothetical protein